MFGGHHMKGMQIHAVPESERAKDDSGRMLPWAYDYAQPIGVDSGDRAPVEKGPFGRSMRRSRSGASRSRSKTVEPRREEDRIKAENIAAEDAVFGTLRRIAKEDGKRDASGELDSAQSATARIQASAESESEPTEVLLYGFGEDLQWAAIDFYERVSNGWILEDYDCQPPGQRYDVSRSLGRQAAQKSLSRAAMRKKNKYAGGEHWIKVTFDSRGAAELAISRSPHILRGNMVFAELYANRGPQKDEPIPASQAGAQITSEALPITFSTTRPLNASPQGSSTASSATATGGNSEGRQLEVQGFQDSPTGSSSTMRSNGAPRGQPQPAAPSGQSTALPSLPSASQTQARRGKIEGATAAVVLPAELAMAPKQPRGSWSAFLGAGEVIGSSLPRKEDGSFDWDRASLYWRLFWWIDSIFGTDFCGLKADD